MISVSELLAHPSFEGFELITDASGLHNRVRDSRIFEWETGEALDTAFHPGDFVITTLTPYRDASWTVIHLVLRSLLEKNIAALAIKNVYFKSLSEEIIDVANSLHIPIFLFGENSFDDIIFTIKNIVTPEELNSQSLSKLRSILYENPAPAQAELLAKGINQFFGDNIIAGYFMPRDRQNAMEILSQFGERYKADATIIRMPPRISYSLLRFPKGIGVLMSDSESAEHLEQDLRDHYEELGLDTATYSFGIGTPRDRLRNIGPCFQESLYASISSYLDNIPLVHFKDIGLMRIIAPIRNNDWINRYYYDKIEKLLEYDRAHNSNLLYTLIQYVNSNYNVSETADKLFQHGNTVRYRVKKAMEILNIKDGPDSQGQLYVLVRLHEIYDLLLHENI